MMGLGVTYTTGASSSGSVHVVLTFDVKSPAVSKINSKWQLAYGTGSAPACNAAAIGTTRGQQYTVNTEAAVAGGMGQAIGFVLTGLRGERSTGLMFRRQTQAPRSGHILIQHYQ